MSEESDLNGGAMAYPNPIPCDFEGLTKRELFAAMAMQGMMANGNLRAEGWSSFDYANRAIEITDALLDALDP